MDTLFTTVIKMGKYMSSPEARQEKGTFMGPETVTVNLYFAKGQVVIISF